MHEIKTLVHQNYFNYFLPVKETETVDPIKEEHTRRISELVQAKTDKDLPHNSHSREENTIM